ncbi:hypothetical protein ACMC56_01280 [Campylobacterota bacterium DY0563]
MKNKLLILVSTVLITTFISGCAVKKTDVPVLKQNLNDVTRKAKGAIVRGIEENKIKDYLFKKYPDSMESFLEYDLYIKKYNRIAIVLVCSEGKALLEDLSCDSSIDKDYSGEKLACKFYIEDLSCKSTQ